MSSLRISTSNPVSRTPSSEPAPEASSPRLTTTDRFTQTGQSQSTAVAQPPAPAPSQPAVNAATLAMTSRPSELVPAQTPARNPEDAKRLAFVGQVLGEQATVGWDNLTESQRIHLFASAAESRILQSEPPTNDELYGLDDVRELIELQRGTDYASRWNDLPDEVRLAESRPALAQKVRDATSVPIDWAGVVMGLDAGSPSDVDIAPLRDSLSKLFEQARQGGTLDARNSFVAFTPPNEGYRVSYAVTLWDLAQIEDPTLDVSDRLTRDNPLRAAPVSEQKLEVARQALDLARKYSPPLERAALESFGREHGIPFEPLDPLSASEADVGGPKLFRDLPAGDRVRRTQIATALSAAERLPGWKEMDAGQRAEAFERTHVLLETNRALHLRGVSLDASSSPR